MIFAGCFSLDLKWGLADPVLVFCYLTKQISLSTRTLFTLKWAFKTYLAVSLDSHYILEISL